MRLKNKIYDFLVRKNENVKREYEEYVITHLSEHRTNRLAHWKLLWKLNWHYRIRKKGGPFLTKEDRKLIIENEKTKDSMEILSISNEENRSKVLSKEDKKMFVAKEVINEKKAIPTKVEPRSATSPKHDKEMNTAVEKNSTKGKCSELSKVESINVASSNDKNVQKKRIEDKGMLKDVEIVNGGTYLEIKWTKIERVYCYNVYYSTDKKKYTFAEKVYEPTCRISNLSANQKYYVQIKYSYDGASYRNDLEVLEVITRGLNKYEKIFGTKNVCLDGPESEYKRMMSAMNMAKNVMRYDTVSFDIFDTLLFRPFNVPSDLFILVGNKLDIMDFCQLRIDSEKEAREYAKLTRGNTEVSIFDIYKIVENKTGIPYKYGVEVEFETEMELCYGNPYMKRVFDLIRYQGKKIIICSDMYYPSDMLDKLLKKNGYEGYTDIIVSCEYNGTKRNGILYSAMKEKYTNIVHIGDNEVSDIEMAQKSGIACIRYNNVNKKGNRFRPEGMSYLVGSAYAGIVNEHLHNGTKVYSPYYETGFVYAGIYVFGFCQWIHNIAKTRGITKILFLAREGDIYQKVFTSCFDDVETKYVLWSRVPVAKTIVEKNRHPYLLQIIHHKANAIYKSKLTTLFERMGLQPLIKYFKKYRLHHEEYLLPSNEKIVEKLLIDHWDELCECYKVDLEHVKQYLMSLIGESERIAVVDVGWSGNNVLQIKYLVEEVFASNCDVTCLLAATRNVNETYMTGMMQQNQVETYIFSNMYNKFLHDYHQETNKKLNSFFFEIMTQSTTPTFLGFAENGFLFDIPEIENYEHDREIHQGILDFSQKYKKIFEKYPYMYNISGNDAYMPFRMMVSTPLYIKKWYSNFVFGRDLCATQEKAVMETVGEVIEKAGI